jgi:hypothetical protein
LPDVIPDSGRKETAPVSPASSGWCEVAPFKNETPKERRRKEKYKLRFNLFSFSWLTGRQHQWWWLMHHVSGMEAHMTLSCDHSGISYLPLIPGLLPDDGQDVASGKQAEHTVAASAAVAENDTTSECVKKEVPFSGINRLDRVSSSGSGG